MCAAPPGCSAEVRDAEGMGCQIDQRNGRPIVRIWHACALAEQHIANRIVATVPGSSNNFTTSLVISSEEAIRATESSDVITVVS